MANPAELLHDIFESWRDGKSSSQTQRKDDNLKVHRRALKHLDAIEQILAELRVQGVRTSVFEREFSTWCRTIFCYPYGWTSGGTAEIPQPAMDALENLIGYAGQVVLRVDETKLASLSLYLDAIEIALQGDKTLNMSARLQLQTSIDHLRGCIEDLKIVGDFDFRKAVEELLVRISQVEGASNDKNRWRPWKEHFVWPFIYDASMYGFGLAIGAVGDSFLPMLTD